MSKYKVLCNGLYMYFGILKLFQELFLEILVVLFSHE